MEITRQPGQGRDSAFAARQAVVARAEAYIRSHMDMPVPLSKLCHVAGCSERGLRNAFYGVRGMSPTRCMLHARLRRVRGALHASETTPTTVTGAATAFGFYELGRFAATYKKVFGEAPSETLRNARTARVPHRRGVRKECKCPQHLAM